MRPVGGNKDLYAFSEPCTKFTYSCSARQNPYEFFLHEYVNFVHGAEKPYSSLSTKIYIFMQCAPKSFTRFSSLRADAGIGRIGPIPAPAYYRLIWPVCRHIRRTCDGCVKDVLQSTCDAGIFQSRMVCASRSTIYIPCINTTQ